MVRKLRKAERLADALPESDAREHACEPYASREKTYRPDPCCDCTPEDHQQDYKNSLDVTVRSRWLLLADIALASEIEERQRCYGQSNSAEFDELLRKVNDHRMGFLQADVDLALTMAEIAAAAEGDAAKRERNTRNARKSYEVVMRLRHKVNATAAQRHQLDRKLTHLHMLLAELGEHFQSLPFAT